MSNPLFLVFGCEGHFLFAHDHRKYYETVNIYGKKYFFSLAFLGRMLTFELSSHVLLRSSQHLLHS